MEEAHALDGTAAQGAAGAMVSRELSDALGSLDAGSRALLDLSLRRGLPDDELALMLDSTPEAISRRRTDLLDQLGAAVANGGFPETERLEREVGELLSEAPPGAPDASAAPGDAASNGSPEQPAEPGEASFEEAEPLGHWRTVRRLTIAVALLTMLLVASLIVVAGLLLWN